MNKSILMSIRPQYVAKILNGEKTIEVRKKFPKDYVGWVYIYCTKTNDILFNARILYTTLKVRDYHNHDDILNGKVVARFWCDKVELISCGWRYEDCCNHYETNEMNEKELLKYSCLSILSLIDYLGTNGKTISNIVGYAIHISKLEVFDKPKEIGELKKLGYEKLYNQYMDNCLTDSNTFESLSDVYSLKKAPQSFQFIEGEND